MTRINEIDAAKAICIFLMLVGHCCTSEAIRIYIYAFHMPAFFVFSGFLYHPHHFLHTIRCFFIPVIILSLLHFFELVVTEGYVYTISHYDFLQYRFGLGTGYFSGIWFIWALLGCRLVMGDIPWFRKIGK